ncbi:hypothetical protein NIA69_09780 [Gemmiger formicilis]|nr:hypothetical protein [Gemmiger formicilis]
MLTLQVFMPKKSLRHWPQRPSGYIDDSSTAHVSKEGKLKFVAHPCWLDVGEQESNKFTLTDPYKPYRVEEEDEDYGLYVYDWLGYNNGISHFSHYTQPLSDDMGYGNFDFTGLLIVALFPEHTMSLPTSLL